MHRKSNRCGSCKRLCWGVICRKCYKKKVATLTKKLRPKKKEQVKKPEAKTYRIPKSDEAFDDFVAKLGIEE